MQSLKQHTHNTQNIKPTRTSLLVKIFLIFFLKSALIFMDIKGIYIYLQHYNASRKRVEMSGGGGGGNAPHKLLV